MKTSFRRLATLLLGVAVIGGCASEQPTAVQPSHVAQQTAPLTAPQAAPQADLLGALTSLIALPGVQRTTPLANPITVVKVIGSAGGTLSIPQAGVTVVVPAGALAAPTTITMTARAGSLVAYDFEPHGITFAKPLVFTQQLRGTNASLLTAPFLTLGYYKDASLLTPVGGLVSELLGGVTNLLTWTFTGNIHHFSGYMMGCGRR